MTTPKLPDSEDQKFARALLRLDTKLLGVVMGLVLALVVFVATLWLVIMGGHVDNHGEVVVGPHLALLGNFFIGYKITFLGSFIGALYGFALGSIVGAAIGHIYNKLSLLRMPPEDEISSKW
jgi:hypothetical protein